MPLDSEDLKVLEGVFDEFTYRTLEKLRRNRYFDHIYSVISPGKEAYVFIGSSFDEFVAIKIYRIKTLNFNKILQYIIGDPRFGKIKRTKIGIVCEWAKKEFRNLMLTWELGIRVPKPIAHYNNVLIMEFIGKDGTPAPNIKRKPPKKENIYKWANTLFNWIRIMWNKGNFVHGDINEWNILNLDEEPVLIDLSMGVLREHPLAEQMLERDVENLIKFFSKYGIELSKKDILEKIKLNKKITL